MEGSEMSVGHSRKIVEDEGGVALVIALMLMLVGTVIGIFGVNTGVIETRIAGNERLSNLAFYMADGGADLGPVIVNDVIMNYRIPDYGSEITIDPSLMSEIFGGSDNDPDTPSSSPDIQNDLGDEKRMDIDLDRLYTKILHGGGAEFLGGYEGIGGGGSAGGSIGIYYQIDSLGSGPLNARANVETLYRKVVNVGGGN
jgi:hypothetical protein